MVRRFEGKTVFITGASSGIGAGLAHAFAHEGARVALLARRLDRLEALAGALRAEGAEVLALQADVTARDQLDAAVLRTVEAFGGIDVAVANAGYGVSGAMGRLTPEDYRRQFETNVFGLIETTYAVLPHLIASRGRLALLGSIMGRVGMPASAPYCASKFAVVGFAESIYYDLREQGVAVTCVNPGIVASEIRSVNNAGEYTGKTDPAPKFLIMPVEKAAKQIVRGLYRRKPELVITGHGKFAIFMSRHFPRTTRAIFRAATHGRMERIEKSKRAQ